MFALLLDSTEAYFTKSIPSTMKMTVKGGAAVDSESGMTSISFLQLSDQGVIDYITN